MPLAKSTVALTDVALAAEQFARRSGSDSMDGENTAMTPELNAELETAQVMIVEDEVLVRTVVAEALREAGLRVIEAANADEAWSYIQAGAPVDLIFSDIQMPGSIDGIELARKVKGDYSRIGIVLTSADPMLQSRKHPFIGKPYRLSNVVATIIDMLEKR